MLVAVVMMSEALTSDFKGTKQDLLRFSSKLCCIC